MPIASGIGAAAQLMGQGMMAYGASLNDADKEKKKIESLEEIAREANTSRENIASEANTSREKVASAANTSRESIASAGARPVVYSTSAKGVADKNTNDKNAAIVKSYHTQISGFSKQRGEVHKSQLTEEEKQAAIAAIDKSEKKYTYNYREQNKKNDYVMSSVGQNPQPLPTHWKDMAAFDRQYPKLAKLPDAEKTAYMKRNGLTLDTWPAGQQVAAGGVQPSAKAHALAQGSPTAGQQTSAGRSKGRRAGRRKAQGKVVMPPEQYAKMVNKYKQALRSLSESNDERGERQSKRTLENLEKEMLDMGFSMDDIGSISYESPAVNLSSARPVSSSQT